MKFSSPDCASCLGAETRQGIRQEKMVGKGASPLSRARHGDQNSGGTSRRLLANRVAWIKPEALSELQCTYRNASVRPDNGISAIPDGT